jgi:NADH-quinone oxidoreductase subunit N
MESIGSDLIKATPLFVLLLTGLVAMLADAFNGRQLLTPITAVGIIASTVLAIPAPGLPQAVGEGASLNFVYSFNNMIAFGGTFSLIHIFLCMSGLFALFFIDDYMRRQNTFVGETYPLLTFALVGMVLLATANDLIIVFIGLELMSICLYVMAASFQRDIRSNEAGFKYFLLGAFATGFLLYGIALLYGLAQSTHLTVIAEQIQTDDPAASITQNLLFYPAIGMILIGFLFKVSAFPFHSWTPDVYTGSPTPLAGFMATGSKMAAFVALSFFAMRAIPSPAFFGETNSTLYILIGLVALASMLYGNLVAMQQKNIKRILAYSSIAHTGYLLLGLLAGPEGYKSIIFYMLIYTIMTVGAFGIVSMVEHRRGGIDLADWRGLGTRRPMLGAIMSAFLFSLTGIPPLAGFIGKYLVFGAVIQAGLDTGSTFLITLATLGILTSVIGAYYYLRIIVVMYFEQPKQEALPAVQRLTGVKTSPTQASLGGDVASQALPLSGALLMGILLVVLGVYPSAVFNVLDSLYNVFLFPN